MRDLLEANVVIDEIKQHEDFTLTFRVLDLTSRGLTGVSDASLGGADRFGNPTDQDSNTVKVSSQARFGIFIGEKPLVPQASSTGWNVILARSHECVVRAWLQRLEVWACKWTQCSSMRTC